MIKVGKRYGRRHHEAGPPRPAGMACVCAGGSIRDATTKAKSLGGVVMEDVEEVMGMGWLSIVQDPTGALFGLWQPKSK